MSQTISIDLAPEMAELVRSHVESGAYASQGEVIEDALRLWQQRADRLAAVKASLDEAATDTEPVPASELRAHFERRFADLDSRRR